MPSIRSKFSDDFVFGAATAAYQIEGSKFGGCGESIWDHFAKNGGQRLVKTERLPVTIFITLRRILIF